MILALIVAVSLAVIPAAAKVVMPSPIAMTVAAQADSAYSGCCDHRNEPSAAVCMLKCAVFAGALIPAPAALPAVQSDRVRFFIIATLIYGHPRRPPTHPPPY